MSFWTLEYGGVEKKLGEWGLTVDFGFDMQSKGRHTVIAPSVDGFDSAAQFVYDEPVIIYRDRSAVGAGGAIFFQGYAGQARRMTDGGRQYIQYTFHNLWWKLERLSFKQTRKKFAGYTTPGNPHSAPTYTDIFLGEIYLGEKADETYQTNGEQITEILNWANECWNPTRRGGGSPDASQDILQIGTIDPAVNIPKTRVTDIFCSDGIINLLRWSPDCVPWIDYTTTPPTIHVRSLANLTTVALTITAEQEKRIDLTAQNDRQLSGVMIYYKRTAETDGTVWPSVTIDKYPLGIDDYTPDVSCHTIELVGSSLTHIFSDVEVATDVTDATTAGGGAAATARKAWWLKHDNTLSEAEIDPSSIIVGVATIKDAAGTTVNLTTYPNELIKGSIEDWMGEVAIKATVRAKVSYQRYKTSAFQIKTGGIADREITCDIMLTSAITQVYRGTQHEDSGEAVPVGVAQAVYESVSTLQHAGEIDFVNAIARSDIRLGKKLTLTGPTHTYSNLVVQSISVMPHSGTLKVQFGPSSRLDATGLIELARVNRWRLIYNMPSGRSTGTSAGSHQVDIGGKIPAENTAHGLGAPVVIAATAPAAGGLTISVKKEVVTADPSSAVASDGRLVLEYLDDSDGSRDDDKPAIDIKLSDCFYINADDELVPLTLEVRELSVCFRETPESTPVMRKIKGLFSEVYD